MDPEYAVTLDNWFPQPGYAEIRKGFDLHASVTGPADDDPVESLLVYQGTTAAKLFAAMDGLIYDVTTAGVLGVDTGEGPFMNDRWQWINVATSGGHFLWGCNGEDDPIIFDGSTWSTAVITGVTEADMIHVTLHKGRIWTVMVDSMLAAYLAPDSIQGAALTFDLGGVFTQGGFLMAVDTWTRDGGSGPDDYLIFVSSRGQVAIYSMVDPGDPDGFFLVGVYDLGPPLGRRCTEKIGPDLAIVSLDGVYSLSQATALDRSVVANATITTRVQPAINSSARFAGDNFGWQFITYPRGTAAYLNVPLAAGGQHQYVLNTLTGAWCRFTGMNAWCWAKMNDVLYFGGDGLVLEADASAGDFGGAPFVADLRTAFSYYGERGRKKRWPMVQPIIETTGEVSPSIGIDVDFRREDLTDPIPIVPIPGAIWGSAIWGEDLWGASVQLSDQWQSADGLGYAAAVHIKVTIAGQPLGQELVSNTTFAAWTGDNPDDFTVTGEAGGNIVTDDTPGARFLTVDTNTLSITQTCMEVGKRYYVTAVISLLVDGTAYFGIGAQTATPITAVGTYSASFNAVAAGDTDVILYATGETTDFTCTSLSVKEIFNDAMIGSNPELILQLQAINTVYETGEII